MNAAAAKIATIVCCVERAREEYAAAGAGFQSDYTRQDAAVLNILRACEAAVDLANMAIRARRLGLPTEMKESFALLERGRLIAPDLSQRMQSMIGFRNIAVHQYKKLDINIVESILSKNFNDLLEFAEVVRPSVASV